MQSQWTVRVLQRDRAAFKTKKTHLRLPQMLFSRSLHPSVWPGCVEGAGHDRTPALTPHTRRVTLITVLSSTIWCHSR